MKMRAVHIADSLLLLTWKNDMETRRNSMNQDIVEWEEHEKWFMAVLRNPLRRLYIAEDLGTPLGTVRADYDKEDDTWELSWTISPDYREKGVGTAMVSMMIDLFDWTVKARIKIDNIASIKIAINVGMHQYDLVDGIQYWRRSAHSV